MNIGFEVDDRDASGCLDERRLPDLVGSTVWIGGNGYLNRVGPALRTVASHAKRIYFPMSRVGDHRLSVQDFDVGVVRSLVAIGSVDAGVQNGLVPTPVSVSFECHERVIASGSQIFGRDHEGLPLIRDDGGFRGPTEVAVVGEQHLHLPAIVPSLGVLQIGLARIQVVVDYVRPTVDECEGVVESNMPVRVDRLRNYYAGSNVP